MSGPKTLSNAKFVKFVRVQKTIKTDIKAIQSNHNQAVLIGVLANNMDHTNDDPAQPKKPEEFCLK